MLSKLTQFVKIHQADIILVVGVILISLLSFALGYIVAKTYDKQSIQIENNEPLFEKGVQPPKMGDERGYYWSGDSWSLSCLETFQERLSGDYF